MKNVPISGTTHDPLELYGKTFLPLSNSWPTLDLHPQPRSVLILCLIAKTIGMQLELELPGSPPQHFFKLFPGCLWRGINANVSELRDVASTATKTAQATQSSEASKKVEQLLELVRFQAREFFNVHLSLSSPVFERCI